VATPMELRTQSRKCREAIAVKVVPHLRRYLANHALALAQLAEKIEREQTRVGENPGRKPSRMLHYDVSFFKELVNSDGHAFKCVQRKIAVDASSPGEAFNAAKRQFEQHYRIGDWRLYADTVEINECDITPSAFSRMSAVTQRPIIRTKQKERCSDAR
jgi:hypothetical protein